MEKKILLTGAGGRLGSYLREPLSKICNQLVSTDIKKNIGKLYRVDNNNEVKIIEEGFGIPNTFVWSPDNTNFYFTDTLEGNILKFDFDLENGTLSRKLKFANFNRGYPDG